jgi:hypothetical protein
MACRSVSPTSRRAQPCCARCPPLRAAPLVPELLLFDLLLQHLREVRPITLAAFGSISAPDLIRS